jgi:hypothetical protein
VRTNVKGAYVVIYGEYRPRRDIAIRGEVANVSARSRFRLRDQYVGSRAAGVLAYRERRAWDFDPVFTLRVRKVL